MTKDPNATSALPKLTPAQAHALRLADRDGLRWSVTRACWVWGHPGVGVQMIPNATFIALDRYGYVWVTRNHTLHPSPTGYAWLAANPETHA